MFLSMIMKNNLGYRERFLFVQTAQAISEFQIGELDYKNFKKLARTRKFLKGALRETNEGGAISRIFPLMHNEEKDLERLTQCISVLDNLKSSTQEGRSKAINYLCKLSSKIRTYNEYRELRYGDDE